MSILSSQAPQAGVDYTTMLPNEVLLTIFEYADVPVLIAGICKRWREIINGELKNQTKKMEEIVGTTVALSLYRRRMIDSPKLSLSPILEQACMIDYVTTIYENTLCNLETECETPPSSTGAFVAEHFRSFQWLKIQDFVKALNPCVCVEEGKELLTLDKAKLKKFQLIHHVNENLNFLLLALKVHVYLIVFMLMDESTMIPTSNPTHQLNELAGQVRGIVDSMETPPLRAMHFTQHCFPEEFYRFSGLEILKAPSLYLAVAPDFSKFKQLTEIDLSQNQLTRFPESLLSLSKLQKINLEDNWLTHIPERISELYDLEVFDAAHNALHTFPLGVLKCDKLTQLYLRNNVFESVPDSIGSCKKLTILGLGYNPLQGHLPHSLFSLDLEELSLANIGLAEIPQGLFKMTNLKKLDLKQNSFYGIPSSLGQLKQLQYLAVGDNTNLCRLPENLGKLKKLTFLDIKNTPNFIDHSLVSAFQSKNPDLSVMVTAPSGS